MRRGSKNFKQDAGAFRRPVPTQSVGTRIPLFSEWEEESHFVRSFASLNMT